MFKTYFIKNKTDYELLHKIEKNHNVCVAGICRNLAFPEMPRQFRKCLDFPQLPRQLQKWYLIYYIQNLGNGKTQKKLNFKSKLD